MIKKKKKEGAQIEEEFIWRVFSQIVCALKECHRHREAGGARKPILHRDIKPENILITTKGKVKLADLGLAKAIGTEDSGLTLTGQTPGTPKYMAPELFQGVEFNETVDVYRCGWRRPGCVCPPAPEKRRSRHPA